MNSNGLTTLLSMIKKEQKNIDEIKREMDILPMGKRNNVSLVDTSKNILTPEKEKKIQESEKRIDDTVTYLNWYSTFNFNNVVSFLIDTINKNENTLYGKVDLSFNTNIVDFNHHYIKTGHERICIITEQEILSAIEDLNDENMVMNIINSANKKYIKLNYEPKYSLYDYSHLRVTKELTSDFPYLSPIIEELIGMRLLNPKASETELIETLTSKIPSNYNSFIEVGKEARTGNHL